MNFLRNPAPKHWSDPDKLYSVIIQTQKIIFSYLHDPDKLCLFFFYMFWQKCLGQINALLLGKKNRLDQTKVIGGPTSAFPKYYIVLII